MKKYYLFIAIMLVAVFSGAVLWKDNAQKTYAKQLKERSWNLLQEYITAAKNHNLEEVKRLSYQVSPACLNESTKIDCEARMDTVYFFGSMFTQDEFSDIWYDSKQVIMVTPFQSTSTPEVALRARSVVYFVIDNGILKLLRFTPSQGAIEPLKDLSEEELNKKLIEKTEDKDMDGIEDYIEQCKDTSASKNCTPTSPNKRDSDSNGYWDGVEAQFLKNS